MNIMFDENDCRKYPITAYWGGIRILSVAASYSMTAMVLKLTAGSTWILLHGCHYQNRTERSRND